MATCILSDVDGTLISLQPAAGAIRPSITLRPLIAPDEAISLHEDRVGHTDYLWDWLSCVSATTGIGVESLYVAGRECRYAGSSLLVPESVRSATEALWLTFYELRDTYRVIGAGLYLAYYLSSISTGDKKTKYGLLDGLVSPIVLVHVELGVSLRRLREESSLGSRSTRQSGAVTWYEGSLYNYWSSFRSVVLLDGLMFIPHLCDGEVEESRARLQAGLVPYRRYNTPIMRRGPRQVNGGTPSLRAAYKWMAWELIRSLRGLAGLTPLREEEILIDKRGVLRIPMETNSLEYAFTSLWSKIDGQWNRIFLVTLASPGEEGPNVVSVDELKYTIYLDERPQ